MAIYRLDDLVPDVHPSAWVHESAQVIGAVTLGANVSIWPGAVLRGDSAPIRIGANSNVQDNSVIHADEGVPTTIGENVTIGHLVMLHGCTVGDHSLIGIGAIVLNRASIGRYCLVGAGSLVTEGKEFAEGSMIVGAPARVIRPLSEEQLAGLKGGGRHYVENGARFRAGLVRIDGPKD